MEVDGIHYNGKAYEYIGGVLTGSATKSKIKCLINVRQANTGSVKIQ